MELTHYYSIEYTHKSKSNKRFYQCNEKTKYYTPFEKLME